MGFERGLRRHIGLASTAVGITLCVALPLASPARAGDDMFGAVGNLLKVPLTGPSGDNGDAIDYRPRPALVVPPTNDLPPPHSSVTRTANWPKGRDSTAFVKAQADSRRPAPSSDSQIPGDAGSQVVFLPENGPNCNSVAGIPMCFDTPWGQHVALPGAAQSSEPRVTRLSTTPTRKYLTDPPVTYTRAVQLSQSESENKQGQGGQKSSVAAAPAEQPPASKCAWPGWFGCPERPSVQVSQSEQGYTPAQGGQKPAETAPAAEKPTASKCAWPGWFGCPYNQ